MMSHFFLAIFAYEAVSIFQDVIQLNNEDVNSVLIIS